MGHPVHPNAALVTRFYASFAAQDADGMAACYHPDVTFTDPVFGTLRGPEVAAMWRMLLVGAEGLVVEASEVSADDREGAAHWTARYPFGRRRRQVENRIRARFVFAEGRIIRHSDRFSFWRWSRQAFGPLGIALGWTPFFRARVRRDVRRRLDRFVHAHGGVSHAPGRGPGAEGPA